jgi:hypothetical protein
MPPSTRSAATVPAASPPSPAPFKRRSFTGAALSPSWSAVAPGEGIAVSGEVAADRPPGDPSGLSYSGRLRIPRAKSRGLIVGYRYRLAVAGDAATAPLEIVVKFVGTPEATADVVSVDFVGEPAAG